MMQELDSFTRNFKHFKTGMHTTLKTDAYFEQKEPQYKLHTVKFHSDDFKSDEQKRIEMLRIQI